MNNMDYLLKDDFIDTVDGQEWAEVVEPFESEMSDLLLETKEANQD